MAMTLDSPPIGKYVLKVRRRTPAAEGRGVAEASNLGLARHRREANFRSTSGLLRSPLGGLVG